MPKESYEQPEITSEELEAGALGCYGSPDGQNQSKFFCPDASNPLFSFCCEGN